MKLFLRILRGVVLANLLAFAVVAAIGWHTGVNNPFPAWFRLGSDACFYLGIAFFVLSLPPLTIRRARESALVSATVAGATLMAIAFLTEQK